MASALTISVSRCSARSRATSDLPVAAGPTSAITSGRDGDPGSGRCAVIVAEPTQGAPVGGDRGLPAMNQLEPRSEEHTSELQSRGHLVCRLLLEKKKKTKNTTETRKEKQNTTRTPHRDTRP